MKAHHYTIATRLHTLTHTFFWSKKWKRKDNGKLFGMVTLTDVLKINSDQRATTKVSSVMTKELVTTIPDESLYTAFGKMTSNQIGRLPIVEQGDNTKLIGIITREDVWRVYNIEIMSELEEVKLSGSI